MSMGIWFMLNRQYKEHWYDWRKFLAHIWIAVTVLRTNCVCLCTWTHSTFLEIFWQPECFAIYAIVIICVVIQMLPSLIMVMRTLSCVICSDILLDPLAQYVKKKLLTTPFANITVFHHVYFLFKHRVCIQCMIQSVSHHSQFWHWSSF